MSSDYEVVDASEITQWDGEADVVIVGAGAAGCCSAIAAREAGAEVLALDGMIGTLTCDAFGDCGSQTIGIFEHLDSSDPTTSKTNEVYTFSPTG